MVFPCRKRLLFHIKRTAGNTNEQSFTCSALLCSAVSVLHRKSACQVLFHGVHLLLPNKAQKRLTASSLMLATGYHCGFCRFRPFWLCVPAFRRVCLSLRHCAWVLNYFIISCIGVQLVWYTIRAIKMILYAAIWWISPFLFVRFVSTCANSVQIYILYVSAKMTGKSIWSCGALVK